MMRCAKRQPKMTRNRLYHDRAFTLVEMLIVIGVILLLVALTVMVTGGMI